MENIKTLENAYEWIEKSFNTTSNCDDCWRKVVEDKASGGECTIKYYEEVEPDDCPNFRAAFPNWEEE
jgi:hypothetical protein